jgi:hypothetical protein
MMLLQFIISVPVSLFRSLSVASFTLKAESESLNLPVTIFRKPLLSQLFHAFNKGYGTPDISTNDRRGNYEVF